MSGKEFILILLLCGIVIFAGCKKSPGSSTPNDMNELKKEVSKTIQTGSNYFNTQKEAAVKKAQETYTTLANESQQLISNIKASGKETWQDLSSDLDQKLKTANQRLTELKAAGEKDLQKTTDAFNDAIDKLKESYQKAKTEFQKTG
jgi:histidinol dehydrogenase